MGQNCLVSFVHCLERADYSWMSPVSAKSTVAVAGLAVAVVVAAVVHFVVNRIEVGKNTDFLVDFVAKRLKKSSHLMKD